MRKLQNRRGETLIETLMALLIATLVILFLATAVVTAARVNDRVRENDVSFRYEDTTQQSELTLTVVWSGGTESCTVQEYTTADEADVDWEYRYYTYKNG